MLKYNDVNFCYCESIDVCIDGIRVDIPEELAAKAVAENNSVYEYVKNAFQEEVKSKIEKLEKSSKEAMLEIDKLRNIDSSSNGFGESLVQDIRASHIGVRFFKDKILLDFSKNGYPAELYMYNENRCLLRHTEEDLKNCSLEIVEVASDKKISCKVINALVDIFTEQLNDLYFIEINRLKCLLTSK